MDTKQNTALLRALAEVPAPLPDRGVIHVVIPHTDRFTVVGNHLAQNAGLSTTAVGFAVRIQSLPQGTEVGVKALAARFPEGEKLIAAALRELEAHGYLQRARTRLPNGRIVTRTVFCNQPAALLRPRVAAAPPQQAPPAPQVRAPAPASVPAPAPGPAPAPKPEHHAPEAPRRKLPYRRATPPSPPRAAPDRAQVSAPAPAPAPAPRADPELERISAALLSDLHHHSLEFTLSEEHVHRLVPGVAAWLERDTHPDTIRHALTTNAPEPVKYPYQFVKHRLTALLPPPLTAPPSPPSRPATAANAPSAPPPPATAATAEPVTHTKTNRPPPDGGWNSVAVDQADAGILRHE
ncbi:hypothetical protein ACN24L_14195 [Streptomyces microflavus]